MKKNCIILCFCIFCLAFLFAQQQVEIVEEKGKTSMMTIEFIPSVDEARFIFSCPAGLFDQGEAVKSIKERAVLFTKERGYFFYTYIRPDVTKYDNTGKTAVYTSFIKFLN
ncbi:MAG: hypothetical protein NC041_00740 [Bacteroides sp.]|nr:hypothetical protein [Prevotella sp.]MCM1408004.1 hypothetical protein [Treponema brennaborense]MCM1468980.1 hypothetical protein [Bacteroides sp.]